MKNAVCGFIGVIGGVGALFLADNNEILHSLIIFMVIDYLSGIVVAAIFKNSQKTESGGLSSKIGWKGLCQKIMILAFVLVGNRIDTLIGANYIEETICIGFMTNELISITENAGLMGIPLPSVVKKAIDILNEKNDIAE